MEFTGFRDDAFAFFKELTENNSEEWFDANQSRFEEFVLQPMRALVENLREDLRRLHPSLVQEDIDAHFSEMRRGPHSRPGSAPIKTSFYCFFWDSAIRRLNDGWFFVGVGADGVTIGMSIYDFGDPESRMRRVFKPRLRRYLTHLDDYIKANYLRRGFDFHRYVRAAGKLGIREVDAFPSAAAEWDSTLGWVIKRHLHTESSRLTPGSFLTEVKESFERLYPLYSFTSDPREEFLRLLRVPMRARLQAAGVVATPKSRVEVSAAAVAAPPAEKVSTAEEPAAVPTPEARGNSAAKKTPAKKQAKPGGTARKKTTKDKTEVAAPAAKKKTSNKPKAAAAASKKKVSSKPKAGASAAKKKKTSNKPKATAAAAKKKKTNTKRKASSSPAKRKTTAKRVAKKKATSKRQASTKKPTGKRATKKKAVSRKTSSKKTASAGPVRRKTAKRGTKSSAKSSGATGRKRNAAVARAGERGR